MNVVFYFIIFFMLVSKGYQNSVTVLKCNNQIEKLMSSELTFSNLNFSWRKKM